MSEFPKDRSGEENPEEKKIPYGDGYFLDDGDGEARSQTENNDLSEKKKSVSMTTYVTTNAIVIVLAIALIVASIMTTYTLTSAKNRGDGNVFPPLSETDQPQNGTIPPQYNEYITAGYPFILFSEFIDKYTFEESDPDERMDAALKAYVAATGDRYAYYYTAEEYTEMMRENSGENEGIGINIINVTVNIDGKDVQGLKVINVNPKSPAFAAGLKNGDIIYKVGIGQDAKEVNDIGYEDALSQLKGPAGSTAEFVVKRPNGSGGYLDDEDFAIERAPFVAESIYQRVHSVDPTVGVLKILQFDLTTPQEFSADMDELIAKGCTRFVFDVRNNPGGDLRSIAAVLSYFLNEGDVIIRTEYKDGHDEIDKVKVVSYGEDDPYHGCSVSADDIGKYRRDDLEFVVLCDGSTASAAELFTATFQDYGLGDIVGTKTYGKGSMQRIRSLLSYGYGALKLTVAKYYSGKNGGYNDGYDGVGIVPDDVVELSESLENKNIYDITDAEDNQLQKALTHFK